MCSAADPKLLAQRAETFLYSGGFAGPAATELLDAIGRHGSAAVFGGLLRDLSIHEPEEFASDIDLVVATSDWPRLRQDLMNFGGERTRYGGLRLQHGGWQFDVWSLRETWAFRKGLVRGSTFADLVHTTFFNWDAIVLDVTSRALHYPLSYFADLNARFLEINLEENANPIGNLARAIRFALAEHARWGPRMKAYVLRELSGQRESDVRQGPLRELWPEIERLRITERLSNDLRTRPTQPFGPLN